MKKILFITNLIPYPLDNGGKIKSYNTIVALSKIYNIDLLCFANSQDELKHVDALKDITDNVNVVVKTLVRSSSKSAFIKDYASSLFSAWPYSINKFYDNRFKEHLLTYIKKNTYDFIYVDHLPMMVYNKHFNNIPILLDQHNVESLIFKRFIETESSRVKKILGTYEYAKLKKFEIQSMHESSQIICLSKNDQQEFHEFGVSTEKLSVLPIHIKLNKKYEPKKHEGGKFKLLFLGSMSWYPNQNGLKWFMENVWPKLNHSEYELYIVGSKPPAFIQSYHNGENVFVTGYVDDVDEYIELCDLSIVPLFVGSGQRVKIIESFAKGIPVISTSIGAEGLIWENGKEILIADDSNEFINKLNTIKSNPNMLKDLSVNAMNTFETYYSSDKLPRKIEKIIQRMDLKG
ncbi:glycosyltransferase [Priestia aryabhattai]|jgi:glycosyltransferase involved in cell wall biosynthesis|uniref:Glycosyltransferase n=1 Tax=Priestia megaterium TaxID=1404 RepID=A0A2B9SR66_PRIMG|nr:glycosyltransferase [Priestia megaterium]MDH3174013.1 glycosyltransferase [Priestia megaterium]PGO62582.1 hypothetical protein CN981_00160 [Priestia megaterium]RDZ14675.1 hypothetical protein C3744_12320 [Priestia megaterium]